jgi:sterol 3beta-glucosyltransferase
MRMTLIAHGTRGDVQPFVVLGLRLAELGHDVTLAASQNHQRMAEDAELRFLPIPIDLESFIESDEGRSLMAKGRGARLASEMAKLHHERRAALNAQVAAACEGAEMIVGNVLTMDRGLVMADKLRVPFVMVNSFPLFPTAEFPSPMVTTAKVPFSCARRMTHRLLWWLWQRGNAQAMAELRRELGLPAPKAPLVDRLTQPGSLIVSHFSDRLVPRPADWPKGLHMTGFFQVPAKLRGREAPPEELVRWLDAGAPPVFVGFGSMPIHDPERRLRETAKVARARGLRAVVNLRGASHGPWAEAPEDVFVVGAIDHDWLMPKCRAAVHHGGAGTLAASLGAGLPTMVCSVWADQPFWGNLVARSGVGWHVLFPKLNAATLDEGLAAITREEARTRALHVRDRLAEEGDGSGRAACLISEYGSRARPLA